MQLINNALDMVMVVINDEFGEHLKDIDIRFVPDINKGIDGSCTCDVVKCDDTGRYELRIDPMIPLGAIIELILQCVYRFVGNKTSEEESVLESRFIEAYKNRFKAIDNYVN